MKTDIRWPERFLPANSAVFVSNQINIAAPPEQVWRWLIRAEHWPQWYPNSSDIHFISTSGPDLRERTRFRWNTFGVRITSKVLEFEPCTRIAWQAEGIGLEAYHAWLLTPLPDGGTHVLTQETQHGWLANLAKRFSPASHGDQASGVAPVTPDLRAVRSTARFSAQPGPWQIQPYRHRDLKGQRIRRVDETVL